MRFDTNKKPPMSSSISKSMYDYMKSNNEAYPNQIALICGERRITYLELFRYIDFVARLFCERGIKLDDIVALCSLSTPETIVAFYVLNKLGVTVASVDPRKSKNEIRSYMEEVQPTFLLILDVFADKFDIGKMCSKGRCVLMSSGNEMQVNESGAIKWHDFVEGSASVKSVDWVQDENAGRKIAAFMHTSGTTGFPKRVMLTNENFNSIAEQYKISFKFERQKTFLSIIPFFLCYGLNINIHLPLCAGVSAVLVPNFEANRFVELLQATRSNYVAGMPYFYEKLGEMVSCEGADLSFLEIVACGGDFLGREAEDRLNATLELAGSSAKVIKGFGMTELCSTATTCTPEHNPIGSVGRPLPFNSICILSIEDDSEVPLEEIGQVCIAGPSVMRGYLNDEETTEKVIFESKGKRWIRTGDAGYLDVDGNLYVTGRIKRSFMRKQAKVYPEAIEATISAHPLVKGCSVVGRTLDASNTEPIAFVVIANSGNASIEKVCEELFDICQAELAEFAIPSEIRFVDELPLTAAGKIDYQKLEQRAKK